MLRGIAALVMLSVPLLGQSPTTSPPHEQTVQYGGLRASEMRAIAAHISGTNLELTECLDQLGIAYIGSYDTPQIDLATVRDVLPQFSVERCDNCQRWFHDELMLADGDAIYCEQCGH